MLDTLWYRPVEYAFVEKVKTIKAKIQCLTLLKVKTDVASLAALDNGAAMHRAITGEAKN